MNNFWIEFFRLIGTVGAASVVLGFLSKTLLSHWFQKDLETFKISLTHNLQQDIFRFSKMHERRADVVEKTYQKIYRVEKNFSSLMSPLQLSGEDLKEIKAQKAAESANDLLDYFGEHRIYFSNNLLDTMDKFLVKLREIWNDWKYKEDLTRADPEYVKAWGESWRKMQEDIPDLKLKLEHDFKEIIGVTD